MSVKEDKAAVVKLSLEELKQSVEELRTVLFQHRLSVITSDDTNTAKIKFVRKQIARRLQQISSLTIAELKANA